MVQGQTPHLEMGPSCNIGCGFLIRWTKKKARTTIDPRVIQPRLPPAYRKRFSLSTRLYKLSESRYLSPCPPNIPGQLCQIAHRPDSATTDRGRYIIVRKRQRHESEIHMDKRTWMRWSASMVFECFSQRMCLTFTAVAAFNPLPCQGPSRSAHRRIKNGYSMYAPFPPCLPSLLLSLCPSRRSSCL